MPYLLQVSQLQSQDFIVDPTIHQIIHKQIQEQSIFQVMMDGKLSTQNLVHDHVLDKHHPNGLLLTPFHQVQQQLPHYELDQVHVT